MGGKGARFRYAFVNHHYHAGIEHIVVYGASAILMIHVIRFVAARAVNANIPAVQTIGKALGATVHFGG